MFHKLLKISDNYVITNYEFNTLEYIYYIYQKYYLIALLIIIYFNLKKALEAKNHLYLENYYHIKDQFSTELV
jgi:hypothetical protein